MLRVENLTVAYGRILAVRDISLHISQGEIVGLLGPNGAGKSTTLLTIAGAVPPLSGNILFENESLRGAAPEHVVRSGIALVPEGRHIFSTLSVAENLELGMTPVKDRARAQTGLARVLERFPILKTYYRSSAGKLSGGEQQQLAIARALISRPRLLLLDEPSLGLAPMVIDSLFEALTELRDEGVTIFLVEQDVVRTLKFADRVYVLRAGAITGGGSAAELLPADVMNAYLGVSTPLGT